jgi:hypothetical protein
MCACVRFIFEIVHFFLLLSLLLSFIITHVMNFCALSCLYFNFAFCLLKYKIIFFFLLWTFTFIKYFVVVVYYCYCFPNLSYLVCVVFVFLMKITNSISRLTVSILSVQMYLYLLFYISCFCCSQF